MSRTLNITVLAASFSILEEVSGNDVIVGGSGIDKIDQGDGQDVVASGDLSSIILNTTEPMNSTPSSTMTRMRYRIRYKDGLFNSHEKSRLGNACLAA